MCKPIAIALLVSFVSLFFGADRSDASPALAEDWGVEAAALYDATLQAVEDGVTERYMVRVARFGQTAARLADWVDTGGGSAEFVCIFRGFAEEADVQITVLDAGGTDKRHAMRRLIAMFSDAEIVAAAAVHAMDRGPDADPDTRPAVCPASPAITRQYLTEQP